MNIFRGPVFIIGPFLLSLNHKVQLYFKFKQSVTFLNNKAL